MQSESPIGAARREELIRTLLALALVAGVVWALLGSSV